jgi:hypothetical protein
MWLSQSPPSPRSCYPPAHTIVDKLAALKMENFDLLAGCTGLERLQHLEVCIDSTIGG